MSNLNKMKKCELINYCKELEKIKKENRYFSDLIKEVKEDYENVNKENEKLIKENEEIKINTMKCCKDLGNKNEELKKENEKLNNIVNKGNEAYEKLEKQYEKDGQEHSNYWSKSIELERYNKLKEENEKLKLELVNSEVVLGKLTKSKEHYFTSHLKERKKAEEYKEKYNDLQKDYEDIKRRNLNKSNEIDKLKKEIEFNAKENLHFTSLETELHKYISFIKGLDSIREQLELDRDTNI